MSSSVAPSSAIVVDSLRRSYRSPIKNEGFKGTLEALFHPKYKEHEALKGVSFTIAPGEFVGLIGANGAGKTTLLKALSGLIPPTSGQARVLGFTPFDRSLEFRRQISLVMGQKAQLWWDLPAADAFRLQRAIYEIPEAVYRERVELLTEILDVKRLMSTQIRRLSLGERMKMELIGAVLHWPKVIFLDEPTIGLDILAASKLREFLLEFNRRERATIILTSHNMDDIERLCPRILILRTGELIYDGAPSKLTDEGERRLRVRFAEAPSEATLIEATTLPATAIEVPAERPVAAATSDDDASAHADAYYFNLPQARMVPVLQTLMTRFRVVDMGIEQQSLESVIQRIYEK